MTITIEDACKAFVKSLLPRKIGPSEVDGVFEAETYWRFAWGGDIPGNLPVAVEKSDGRTWAVFPPDLTDEQWAADQAAKELPRDAWEKFM